MPEILDVDGSPLAPESVRMLEYLRTRSQEMSAVAIREKIRKAAEELESALESVTATQARLHPVAGKWSIAEVVDHIAQTQIRGTEELRHLLAGRRPPLPPVYEALRSGAGQWAPWNLLVEEVHAANGAMADVLDGAVDSISSDAPTVRTVMVALRKLEEERTEPQIYFAELSWKEYALLQRLHLLDHRTQVKKLHASIASK
jgi:DinB superfamily